MAAGPSVLLVTGALGPDGTRPDRPLPRVQAEAAGTSRGETLAERLPSPIWEPTRSGAERGGRERGRAPTVAMWAEASPNTELISAEARLPSIMAALMYGTLGSQRLVAMPASRVIRATLTT